MQYTTELSLAKQFDAADPLKDFRTRFHMPKQATGEPFIYLCGNSLGLQPITTADAVNQELLDWQRLGVEGHFHAKHPWMPYHSNLTSAMAQVVGAKPIEVVVMNTLTVNLHLMMVSFYRPEGKRNKILIEADAFPSDRYAAESQIKSHGLDPADCLIALKAREGEVCLRAEDIQQVIAEQGQEIALIMLGNTNYYTGQFFDMKQITEWGHAQGCKVGFDCAHGAGNVDLDLHNTGCDFAVWCNYKYLNSGPGGMGGVFVHERYAHDKEIQRFTGWGGHNQDTRFKMRDGFEPMPGADAWQLSNPPILAMAAVWSSLQLFEEAGMDRLREKAVKLTGYAEYLIKQLGEEVVRIITPADPQQRGSQLSVQVKSADKKLFARITEAGVIADWREPDVIRIAPVPMYNSFVDVHKFYSVLCKTIT